MRKISIVLGLTAALSGSSVFADDLNTTVGTPTTTTASQATPTGNKPCMTIANACLAAGFVRTEAAGKRIWQDCMKPIILGQTVQGVNIDSATAASCRTYKINKLTTELQELQNNAATTPQTTQ
jgi:hypothetical protein